MRIRSKLVLFTVLLLSISVICGCASSREDASSSRANDDEYLVYYVSIDTTKLVPDAVYFNKSKSVKQQLNKMFELLTDAAESLEHKSVLPDKVQMNSYELGDNGLLTIDLSANYYEAVTSARVLCRAAFVKSLTQLDGVDMVSFTVDSQPLVEDDMTLGSMTADSFVDNNTDEDTNQVQDVTIYYTNVTGDRLEPIDIPINLGNNVSAEQLVIEALIDGTQERGYYNTIPEGTKLLSVSTKDTVCYVDLSKEFLDVGDNIKDQTIIYSVVDSLCELSTVSKVAFTIEGEQVSLYNGNILFDQLFERNLDIVDVD